VTREATRIADAAHEAAPWRDPTGRGRGEPPRQVAAGHDPQRERQPVAGVGGGAEQGAGARVAEDRGEAGPQPPGRALEGRVRQRERAALGRSLLRREQASVRAKLGARSACAAEIRATGGPHVVAGWLGVCREVGRCPAGATVTAAEAHALVGQTCALAANAPDGSRGCEGDGPWESTYAHDPGALQRSFIAPIGGDRFFVHSLRIESAPLRCRGTSTVSFSASGKVVTVTTARERLWAAPGRVLPQESVDEGTCLVLPAATTTAVFELATAKALGDVAVVDHHGVTVVLDAERARLALEGGGCDGCFVPIDGSARISCE